MVEIFAESDILHDLNLNSFVFFFNRLVWLQGRSLVTGGVMSSTGLLKTYR